jgi:hypothetical protein
LVASDFQFFSIYPMDWILEHLQIVALIAVGFGTWVKSRMDRARAAQEERAAPAEMAGEEEVFGPATGWPQAPAPTVPSPIVVRASPPPLKRQSMSPAMPVESYRAPVMAKPAPANMPPGQASKATTVGGAAATRTRVSAAQTHIQSGQTRKAGLHASLNHRKAIRHAIVMREILGPPVGLR